MNVAQAKQPLDLASPILVLTQKILLQPDGHFLSSVTAKIGRSRYVKGQLSLDSSAREDVNLATWALISPQSWDGLSRNQLLDVADAYLTAESAVVIPKIRQYMENQGITQAWYHYRQRVVMAGSTQPKQLEWRLLIRPDGIQHRKPVIIDNDPVILQVSYVSKRVAEGLPEHWAYPDAGFLKWRLLDRTLSPQTNWFSFDTLGLFDSVDVGGRSAIQPGLACLINMSPTCGVLPGYQGVIKLMAVHDASGALLDYIDQLQPVYDSHPDPVDPQTWIATPRMSTRFDLRELEHVACGSMHYRNQGSRGYLLETRIHRFSVDLQGNHHLLAKFTGQSLSPTMSFDLRKHNLTTQELADVAAKIVDPAHENGALVDAQNYGSPVFLAPITSTNTDAGICCDFTKENQWIGRSYVRKNAQESVSVELLCEPHRAINSVRMRFGFFLNSPQGCSLRSTTTMLDLPTQLTLQTTVWRAHQENRGETCWFDEQLFQLPSSCHGDVCTMTFKLGVPAYACPPSLYSGRDLRKPLATSFEGPLDQYLPVRSDYCYALNPAWADAYESGNFQNIYTFMTNANIIGIDDYWPNVSLDFIFSVRP